MSKILLSSSKSELLRRNSIESTVFGSIDERNCVTVIPLAEKFFSLAAEVAGIAKINFAKSASLGKSISFLFHHVKISKVSSS